MEIVVTSRGKRVDGRAELEELVRRVAEETLSFLAEENRFPVQPPRSWRELPGEVGIILTSDEEVRALNRRHRGRDAPTDVLSFPLAPDWRSPYLLLGDVVISLERAREQAREYGHSWEREVGYLAVHGLLHLFGYDHATEEERAEMRRCEEAILARLRLERPEGEEGRP
ncbi:MAG: rRNA maturation RNase YbeY [Bacillota bacterium]|nr:rRNA maturation RNase YbeY [Bacillota bacterium]